MIVHNDSTVYGSCLQIQWKLGNFIVYVVFNDGWYILVLWGTWG